MSSIQVHLNGFPKADWSPPARGSRLRIWIRFSDLKFCWLLAFDAGSTRRTVPITEACPTYGGGLEAHVSAQLVAVPKEHAAYGKITESKMSYCCLAGELQQFFVHSVQVKQLENPDTVFDAIVGLVVCFAEHGLIHCDFNEFNIMVL
ncbi:uncharacterized protein LOC131217072 isoform X1 [Magnolia sinica]|uniref:uncharacterized protein LOC131217072 isoform X1 n=1 Tax=Magnolia sinica TaxID=86752 RepID=UPI00265903B0|nr:uncharacterized protein LOC131217072 isoform X1 [Magnolia sinica]